MPDANSYITTVAERIKFWDGDVYSTQIGPLHSTVGHLYDTLIFGGGESKVNGQVHFCVVLAQLPSIDSAFVVEDFARHASAHGYATTKGSPGFGTAEVALACLVSPLVHQSAAHRADGLNVDTLTGVHRAVVVDIANNWVHACFQSSSFRNISLYSAINQRIRRLFPLPAEVDAHPGNPLAW